MRGEGGPCRTTRTLKPGSTNLPRSGKTLTDVWRGVLPFEGQHVLRGKDSLILRLGEDRAKRALTLPSVSPFDITGKPMKGWLMVEPAGFQSEEDLKEWLEEAREFVSHLPPKRFWLTPGPPIFAVKPSIPRAEAGCWVHVLPLPEADTSPLKPFFPAPFPS